jgi:hypothetical protein
MTTRPATRASCRGFTGITAFARYLVAPVMIVWMLYLVVKGLSDLPSSVWSTGPAGGATVPLLTGVGIAIGSVMWGNEPDTWRYGRPRVLWPLPAYAISVFVGLVLFVVGGWMMAELSGAGQYDFGPTFEYTAKYSLFGALWLGGIVATVLQIALNDGNYYEMINGGQNLIGLVPVEAWLIAGVVYLVLSSLTVHRGRRDDRKSQSTA